MSVDMVWRMPLGYYALLVIGEAIRGRQLAVMIDYNYDEIKAIVFFTL